MRKAVFRMFPAESTRGRRAAWHPSKFAREMRTQNSHGHGTRRRGARLGIPVRGYRGRTETPPAKLSTCATCHANGTLRTTTGQAHYPAAR